MRLWTTAIAMSLAAGCTSIDFKAMTPAELAERPDFMMIVPGVPNDVQVIGPVKVELCQKTKDDPKIYQEDVYRALKREAARRGGTALADVNSSMTSSGVRRCLVEADASGTAFVWPKK